MSRKLLYIQLQKAGIPMDPWTLAEVMDIPNFGRAPEGADTVYERWIAHERIKGEMQAHIQAKAQEILMSEQAKLQAAGQAAQFSAAGGQAPGASGGDSTPSPAQPPSGTPE